MNNSSKTDWERIDAMSDDEIDTSDSPILDESFFATAQLRLPKDSSLVTVTLGVDADVLKWYAAQGDEFQTRINAALRIYAEAHQS